MNKKINYISKLVVDNNQQASINDGIITIINKNGKQIVGKYNFSLCEWMKCRSYPTFNQRYNQRILIGDKFNRAFPGNNDIYSVCFYDQIIDSQINAIENVIIKFAKSPSYLNW